MPARKLGWLDVLNLVSYVSVFRTDSIGMIQYGVICQPYGVSVSYHLPNPRIAMVREQYKHRASPLPFYA